MTNQSFDKGATMKTRLTTLSLIVFLTFLKTSAWAKARIPERPIEVSVQYDHGQPDESAVTGRLTAESVVDEGVRSRNKFPVLNRRHEFVIQDAPSGICVM